MSFEGRNYLMPIYKDKAIDIVIKKSVQCGISEFEIISTLQNLRQGRSTLYILPTLEVRNDFVNNRVDRQIEQVPYYRAGSKGTDNTGLKHFWNGTVKFVGSNVPMAFREFPATDIKIDELDQCNMENLAYAKDRVAAAKSLGFEPTQHRVSNPTVAGYGIDDAYNLSDKKQWQIKCPHCNTWQSLDWFVNVVTQIDDNKYESLAESVGRTPDTEDFPVLCRACKKSMDRLASGQWVAENPGIGVSGYHISKLFTNQTTIRQLLIDFQKSLTNATLKQQFWNSELGLAYTGEGDKLSYSDFKKCELPGYKMPMRGEGCIGGVDIGAQLHVRIDSLVNGKRRMVHASAIPNWDELDLILKRYNCRCVVIDYAPEVHMAREFALKHAGILLCQYNQNERSGGQKIDRTTRVISCNRTETMDESTSAYLNGQIELPCDWQSLDGGEWVRQMTAPTRILDIKRKPPAYIWDEAGQPDHHRHADNYCHMAAKLMGFQNAPRRVIWI